jgi:hypothetical protein
VAKSKFPFLETVPKVFGMIAGELVWGFSILITVPAGIVVVLVKTIVHSHVLRVLSAFHALSER